MCGIFGIVAGENNRINIDYLEKIIKHMFLLSSKRGQEASGIGFYTGNKVNVLKDGIPFSKFLNNRVYKEYLKENIGNILANQKNDRKNFSFIGHTRLATNGSRLFNENNHPIVTEKCIGIHNGTITDEDYILNKYPNLSNNEKIKSDSLMLFRLIELLSEKDNLNLALGIKKAFEIISGSASISFIRKDIPILCLATNTGSIYQFTDEEAETSIFFSERFALEIFINSNKKFLNINYLNEIQKIRENEAVFFNLNKFSLDKFKLDSKKNNEKIIKRSLNYKIIFRDYSIEKSNLKRCSKCILPFTYPFITFNEKGVCSYCQNHQEEILHGKSKLEKVFSKHRKNNGEADCIVAFSGGRDSSYGLHLIKKEFGMNPIAFSYDWGMVTDIGRRNQARMVGKLGIEQIIRTENLIKKRSFLRKNVEAWKRNPHLGMVPLFMAGDKFFFDIARNLRKELNIPLVIFCGGNELERTDFKSGFAGVKENNHKQRLFSFSIYNKFRLALFYVFQYLKNPYYINESFLESLLSFNSTFLSKDDFLYLYHYLKWDEDLINKTLVKEYNWEEAENSSNTWRIGDGHTSFINYIYFSVAGFSEYDTFRSQQIRKGLINRKDALELSSQDNQPDISILKEFTEIIGINFEETIDRINSIPKLY